MDHNLKVVEKPANFEQFRWEVTCSCGWQGRGPTEAVAASMGVSHGGKLEKKAGPKVVATTDTPKEEVPKTEASKEATKEDTSKVVSKPKP